MRVVAVILRVLIGLPFFVLGLDHFLDFIKKPNPELPEDAMKFVGALAATNYMTVVKVLEVAGGAILLSGRFVPLGLVILVPVTVNIALWDVLFMKFSGPPIGTVLLALEVCLIWLYRPYFAPLLTWRAKVGAE